MSQPIRGQGGHLVFPISLKNTNLVEDVEILLLVKFCWIPFSGFRGEVENVSANQRPGWPSCFSDKPEKHKLGRGGWDLASCKVWLNSVQRFQRSRKCEKLTTDGRTDDGQRMITIVHLSLRLRCTKKSKSKIHSESRGIAKKQYRSMTAKWRCKKYKSLQCQKMQIDVLLQQAQVFIIVKQYLMSSAYKVQVMPVKEFADNIPAECEWHAPIVFSPSLHLLVRIRP